MRRHPKKRNLDESPDLIRWRCAFDFFVLREPQEQICRRYELSRPTVARHIQAARERFSFVPDFETAPNLTAQLEDEIANRFDLRRAVVAPIWSDDYSLTAKLLGHAASLVFTKLVERVSEDRTRPKVGIAGGETLFHMADVLRPIGVELDLFPMVLGPHPDTELSAGAIAGIIARRMSVRGTCEVRAKPIAHFTTLLERASGDSPPQAAHEVAVEFDTEAADAAKNVDLAFVGIGSLFPTTTMARLIQVASPHLTATLRRKVDLRTFEKHGLGCEILSQFLPPMRVDEGTPRWAKACELARQFNSTVAGVSLDDLRVLANSDAFVVAIAGGKQEKSDALRHALQLGSHEGENESQYFNALVTDAQTAEKLLDR